jgi:acetyl esterase/lipase
MPRRWIVAGGFAVVGCLVLAFVAAREPGPATRTESDVIFAQPGDETLRVDLRLPTGDGPFPAVLCLHGGGWVGGSRKQMAQTLEVLARRGYVAAAPDYRLAPKHRWPACVEDCKAAVRWLRGNAGKYRIDPERVGVVGLSAGGHLACLLGVTEPSDGLEGTGGHPDRPSRVQAVVSFAAPTDLTADALQTDEVRVRNLEPLFGGTLAAKRDDYRKASPALYQPRTPPPFLLIHGADDAVVPVAQARALAEAMKRAGADARVIELQGEGQTWAGPSLTRSIDQMLTFLDGAMMR